MIRRRRGSWSLLCWVFLSLLFLVLASEAGAQDSVLDENISERLLRLKENSKKLERLWNEQKLALQKAVELSEKLQRELAEAQRLLENSENSLAMSEQEVMRLTTLLRESQETLNGLQDSFQAYQQEVTRTIRNRTIGMVAGFLTGAIFFVFSLLQ